MGKLLAICTAVLMNTQPPEFSVGRSELYKVVTTAERCSLELSLTQSDLVRIKGSSVTISAWKWYNHDSTARKVIIIRELLRCEAGLNYTRYESILHKNLIIAVKVYEYGI